MHSDILLISRFETDAFEPGREEALARLPSCVLAFLPDRTSFLGRSPSKEERKERDYIAAN